MSHLELFADEINGYLYIAITNDKKLIDLYVNKPDISCNWASIYLGKVKKIDAKLDAAFIDLGNGLTGYLAAKHALIKRPDEETRRSGITKMLQTGEMLLVQIKAEGKTYAKFENNKLPRLSTSIHTIGGALVYAPYSNGIAFSKSIAKDEMEDLRKKIKIKGGWKIYPGIRGLSDEEIEFEEQQQLNTWKNILEAKDKMGSNPGLVNIGPIVLYRALMDYGAINFERINIGNKKIFSIMESWCCKNIPRLSTSKKLRLFKADRLDERLFDTHDVYSQIDKVCHKTVSLDCGGNIIIEQVAALTIIDVNQGGCNNITETNFSAAKEISKQIKFRNLNGIILIDFINVSRKGDRTKIIDIIGSALAHDIGNTQVHGFTRLGLLEITRKRRTGSLVEKIGKLPLT